jgi:hypothetical protein
MVPYTVRRPVFASIPVERLSLTLRTDLQAGEDFLRRNAYQGLEYFGNAPMPDRRVHLLEGRTVRVDDMPDSKGNFTRTVFYEAAVPVEGIRDLDGDGVPEVREQFQGGRLWKITLDQDGDGVNEFEQVEEDGSKRMYWDYNEDGVFDSLVVTEIGGKRRRGGDGR